MSARVGCGEHAASRASAGPRCRCHRRRRYRRCRRFRRRNRHPEEDNDTRVFASSEHVYLDSSTARQVVKSTRTAWIKTERRERERERVPSRVLWFDIRSRVCQVHGADFFVHAYRMYRGIPQRCMNTGRSRRGSNERETAHARSFARTYSKCVSTRE